MNSIPRLLAHQYLFKQARKQLITLANNIHPTAIIEDGVKIGDGNTIGPFSFLQAGLVLGDGNWIGTGVVLGAPPEVRSLVDKQTRELATTNGLVIGNNNVFREYSQVHQGWKNATEIGNDCYIMNQVYIAHDCQIGNGVTLASSVLLAGHVKVGVSANLGLGVSVHQGTEIGALTMIGMGSVVVRSVPDFAKAFGNPAKIKGTNTVGLERNGFDHKFVQLVQQSLTTPENSEILKLVHQTDEYQAFINSSLNY